MLLGRCKGNVHIYAETHEEMMLKALSDNIWSVPKCTGDLYLKSIGDLFSNSYRVGNTLWEMHQKKQRPDGCISHQIFSQYETRRPLWHPPFLHLFKILNLIQNWRHHIKILTFG